MKSKIKRKLGFAIIVLVFVMIFVVCTIEFSLIETIVGFVLAYLIIATILASLSLITGENVFLIFKNMRRSLIEDKEDW